VARRPLGFHKIYGNECQDGLGIYFSASLNPIWIELRIGQTKIETKIDHPMTEARPALNDLALQGRDAQRSLSPVGLRGLSPGSHHRGHRCGHCSVTGFIRPPAPGSSFSRLVTVSFPTTLPRALRESRFCAASSSRYSRTVLLTSAASENADKKFRTRNPPPRVRY